MKLWKAIRFLILFPSVLAHIPISTLAMMDLWVNHFNHLSIKEFVASSNEIMDETEIGKEYSKKIGKSLKCWQSWVFSIVIWFWYYLYMTGWNI